MGFLARLFNLGKSTTNEETAPYHLADVELGYMIKYKGYDWIVNEVCTGRDFYLPYVDIALESDIGTQKNIAVSSKFTRVYEHIPIGSALDQHLLDADPRRKIAADEPPKVLRYNDLKMLLHSQGLCRHQGTDYLCFEYINKAEKNYLWFQQWSDTDFSLCVGEFEDEKSFEILGPTETPF